MGKGRSELHFSNHRVILGDILWLWMAEAEDDSPILAWLRSDPNHWLSLLFKEGLVASS